MKIMNKEDADSLRQIAFERLQIDKRKFNSDEVAKITEMIKNYHVKNYYYPEMVPDSFIEVWKQINKDIKIYNKYDCLAMWLDWELGLVRLEPDLIDKIATEMLKSQI